MNTSPPSPTLQGGVCAKLLIAMKKTTAEPRAGREAGRLSPPASSVIHATEAAPPGRFCAGGCILHLVYAFRGPNVGTGTSFGHVDCVGDGDPEKEDDSRPERHRLESSLPAVLRENPLYGMIEGSRNLRHHRVRQATVLPPRRIWLFLGRLFRLDLFAPICF